MNDSLIRHGDDEEFPTRERLYIRERLNDPAVPEMSLADARVEVGVTTELHSLDVRECYVIRKGGGLMEVGGRESFVVGPGDCVVIAAGESQRITNTGREDLLFECLCTPRFTPGGYLALE